MASWSCLPLGLVWNLASTATHQAVPLDEMYGPEQTAGRCQALCQARVQPHGGAPLLEQVHNVGTQNKKHKACMAAHTDQRLPAGVSTMLQTCCMTK